MFRRVWIIVFWLVLVGGVNVWAAEADASATNQLAAATELPPARQLADEAEEFFAQANAMSLADMNGADQLYGQAILRYRSLIEDYGLDNVHTYYNLGNAYLLKGDVGRAILNYRRAERFDAADVDLQNNLRLARMRQLDGIAPPARSRVFKTLFFWHYDLGYATRLVATAICWVVFWLMAMRLVMGRKGRRTAVLLLVIAGLMLPCFGVSGA